MKLIDLTGQHFGRLEVLRKHGLDGRNTTWECRCSCGGPKAQSVVVQTYNLRQGKTVSCGCVRKENSRVASTTHGKTRSRVYRIWVSMVQRCTNPKADAYENYGGRGISVCNAWLQFENFYTDMGDPPTSSHTLERQDNDAGYSKANCTWATRVEQSNNKRTNVVLTLNGRSQTLTQWANELGITRCSLQNRLEAGWSLERALTEGKRGKKHE